MADDPQGMGHHENDSTALPSSPMFMRRCEKCAETFLSPFIVDKHPECGGVGVVDHAEQLRQLVEERDNAVARFASMVAARDAALAEAKQAKASFQPLINGFANERKQLTDQRLVAIDIVKELSQRLADRVRAAREEFVRAEAPDVMVLSRARALVEQSEGKAAQCEEEADAIDEDA